MNIHTSTPRARVALGAAVVGALVLAGCGGDDDSEAGDAGDGSAPRVVEVTMTDLAYSPSSIEVAAGETVTFRFVNEGAVVHEAYFGDPAAQEEHHAEMAAMGDHDMDEEGALTVQPGASGEIEQTFTDAGTILIACHQPGHWEAGMKADVVVG